MMQTDIVYYGADLAHYLLDEFVDRDYARYTRVQRFEESRCGATSQKADRGFVAVEQGGALLSSDRSRRVHMASPFQLQRLAQ
jgi:hypothetical protein